MNNKPEKSMFMALFFGSYENFFQETLGFDVMDTRYESHVNITAIYLLAIDKDDAYTQIKKLFDSFWNEYWKTTKVENMQLIKSDETEEIRTRAIETDKIFQSLLVVTDDRYTQFVYHVDDER